MKDSSNSVPWVAHTDNADLDDPQEVTRTLKCPPCTKSCNQGLACTALSPVISAEDRQRLEAGSWTFADKVIAAMALLAIIASALASACAP